MAHGPAPKPPEQRARRNKDPHGLTVITAQRAPQPELPTIELERDGELVEFVWPVRTVEWWAMWGESPLSEEFTQNDWSELLDTALLHARYWQGCTSVAAELRLRVAKFGATPEDRARLRIQFANADDAETKRRTDRDSRARRGPLRVRSP